jgi:hypothetical protein
MFPGVPHLRHGQQADIAEAGRLAETKKLRDYLNAHGIAVFAALTNVWVYTGSWARDISIGHARKSGS